jgi:hypothetical protein
MEAPLLIDLRIAFIKKEFGFAEQFSHNANATIDPSAQYMNQAADL